MTEQPDTPPDDVPPDVESPRDELLQSIMRPKCDLCGSLMVEWHCRMMCPMCGYQRDCSDP